MPVLKSHEGRFLRRVLAWAASLYGLVALVVMGNAFVSGCARQDPKTNVAAAAAVAESPWMSTDCRACHETIFQSWSESHHAHAHRVAEAAADADAFASPRALSLHGVDYQLDWANGRPVLAEKRGAKPSEPSVAEFVLGYTPLRQYVVPVGGGRYQMTELAFDPAKKEWFNVFGDEQRQPGEWGHWRGRGMNWNSMCAHCHLTVFEKNYNPGTDTYASTWREHGVGCVQCHGDMSLDHAVGASLVDARSAGNQRASASDAPTTKPPPTIADRVRQQESCAPCHARNELLTGDVRPGVPYSDHYRLTLPTEPLVFYPDGQMREEDFNMTSLLLSRMGGKAGVTCLDCHEPHGGRLRLPVENNALCLQCHGTPARPGAMVIDPIAHSHHAADSAGSRCVACHMPTTTFMQRDPRHDHGFLKPDPLLTKELGIPNACSRCHADKDVDWAIAATDRWYGPRMESRQRERARVVATAQAGQAESVPKLLALLASEEVPLWRATLLALARPFAESTPAITAAARNALVDPDPIVRSTAVQVLGAVPDQRTTLTPQLRDPVRLVRLDAAWALSDQLPRESPERKELDAYLAAAADQPAGQLRIGQDFFNRGRLPEAEAALRRAAEWDPNSSVIFATLGTVLNAAGRDGEAAAAFWRAAQKNPADPGVAFNAALAFAASGKLPDAELALREAIRRDPNLDRAWYNLGLLLVQTGRASEALEALQAAERIAPNDADYPYARATVLAQRGDRAGAAAAARRAVEIDPNFAPARELIQRLGN